jgi:hypothetical protein
MFIGDSVMELLAGYIFFIAIFYFLPWFVALGRGHNNTVAIFVLNLFLGWTFLGWVIALVWCFTSNIKEETA